MSGKTETYACLVLATDEQDPRLRFLPRTIERIPIFGMVDNADEPPEILGYIERPVEESRTVVTQGRVWCATESGELILVDVSARGAYQVGPHGPHEPRLTFDEKGRVRGL